MARETAPVTALLVVALVAVFGLELVGGREAFCYTYGFVPAHAGLETAFFSLWLHDPDSLFHLGGNLVFLVIFGSIVEKSLGSFRFAALYVAAGLGGCAMHWLVAPGSGVPLVGASGCLFGLLAVAGVLRPRLLGFVAAYVGITIWEAFSGGSGNVSFGCHLGGFFAGFVVVMVLWVTNSEALEVAKTQ